MENADQFPDDFLKLSLFPPFTEDSVVDAEPISYCLRHQSTVDFTLSLYPQVSENLGASKPISATVDFSSIDGNKDHPYSPFLTLFTQVCENFAASKPNIPLPLPPATDLCLSFPSTTTQRSK
ncbi:hypothetical protein KY289_034881 [Solanum tuberosum]|nr:hypothetical protein KY289_034881 [Solanum tuberosum]